MTKLSFLQCFDALVLYLLEYWAGKAAAPKANATYMQLQKRWWCDGGATVVAVAHNAFHQKSEQLPGPLARQCAWWLCWPDAWIAMA